MFNRLSSILKPKHLVFRELDDQVKGPQNSTFFTDSSMGSAGRIDTETNYREYVNGNNKEHVNGKNRTKNPRNDVDVAAGEINSAKNRQTEQEKNLNDKDINCISNQCIDSSKNNCCNDLQFPTDNISNIPEENKISESNKEVIPQSSQLLIKKNSRCKFIEPKHSKKIKDKNLTCTNVSGSALNSTRKTNQTTCSRKSKNILNCEIFLLDKTKCQIPINKWEYGHDLLVKVFAYLYLDECEYFSLCYYNARTKETKWIDPDKHIRSQSKDLKFSLRVKFYPAEPDEMLDELTRYQLYLQIKNEIIRKKLKPDTKLAMELASLAFQSELGDFDPTIKLDGFREIFDFLPNKDTNNEIRIVTNYKHLTGFTPSECELNFLRYAKTIKNYGMQFFSIMNMAGVQYELGAGPKGLIFMRNNINNVAFNWDEIKDTRFRSGKLRLYIINEKNPRKPEKYSFVSSRSGWTKDIFRHVSEFLSFYKNQKKTNFFERPNPRFRNSKRFRNHNRGLGLYQSTKENTSAWIKKSFKRNRPSVRHHRPTCGFIRIGSSVYCKGDNGEYYLGEVTGLSEEVIVKCKNGHILSHPVDNRDAVVFDADPNLEDVLLGSKVIAFWPGIDTYLPGMVVKIEGIGTFTRFVILFYDGESRSCNIDQIRLLKPPVYFGPKFVRIRQYIDKLATINMADIDKQTFPNEEVEVNFTQRRASTPIKNLDSSDKYKLIDEIIENPSTILKNFKQDDERELRSESILNSQMLNDSVEQPNTNITTN